MAKIRLYRDEVNPDCLPPVCIRCGGDAAVYKQRLFSWHPSWVWVLIFVGLLPWAIVAMALTKRMRVYAPFCELHRNHWRDRALYVFGGLAVVALIGFGLVAALIMESNAPRNQGNETLTGWLCFGGCAVAFVWLIIAAVVENRTIHATEITKRTIVLVGVSTDFIDAVEDQRDQEEEELVALEKERRRQWPDEGHSGRRRQRRPLEEDEEDDTTHGPVRG
ncbi:MAG TPA: hypothetical protein VFA18_13225 [Gemmataceae bacterium]|nr:hypothetical protein [Gemmataceae bacterium]